MSDDVLESSVLKDEPLADPAPPMDITGADREDMENELKFEPPDATEIKSESNTDGTTVITAVNVSSRLLADNAKLVANSFVLLDRLSDNVISGYAYHPEQHDELNSSIISSSEVGLMQPHGAVCSKCGKCFEASLLQLHDCRVHSVIKSYTGRGRISAYCELCGAASSTHFTSITGLNRHAARKHQHYYRADGRYEHIPDEIYPRVLESLNRSQRQTGPRSRAQLAAAAARCGQQPGLEADGMTIQAPGGFTIDTSLELPDDRQKQPLPPVASEIVASCVLQQASNSVDAAPLGPLRMEDSSEVDTLLPAVSLTAAASRTISTVKREPSLSLLPSSLAEPQIVVRNPGNLLVGRIQPLLPAGVDGSDTGKLISPHCFAGRLSSSCSRDDHFRPSASLPVEAIVDVLLRRPTQMGLDEIRARLDPFLPLEPISFATVDDFFSLLERVTHATHAHSRGLLLDMLLRGLKPEAIIQQLLMLWK